MPIHRRHLLALASAAAGMVAASPARGAPAVSSIGALGFDAAHFGLRPGSPDDQSRVLQRAVEEAARSRAPLTIAPGVYRVGYIKLPTGTQLRGVRGATKLVLADSPALLSAAGGSLRSNASGANDCPPLRVLIRNELYALSN